MKIRFLLFFILPTCLWAQESFLAENLSLTDADSNYTKITLSGKAFELMGYAQPIENLTPEIIKMAEGISGMLGYMDISEASAKNLLGDIKNDKSLVEYVTAERTTGSFWLFVDEQNGIVSKVLIVAWQNKRAAVGEIYGAFDLKLVGELMKMIPIQDLIKPQEGTKI